MKISKHSEDQHSIIDYRPLIN